MHSRCKAVRICILKTAAILHIITQFPGCVNPNAANAVQYKIYSFFFFFFLKANLTTKRRRTKFSPFGEIIKHCPYLYFFHHFERSCPLSINAISWYLCIGKIDLKIVPTAAVVFRETANLLTVKSEVGVQPCRIRLMNPYKNTIAQQKKQRRETACHVG